VPEKRKGFDTGVVFLRETQFKWKIESAQHVLQVLTKNDLAAKPANFVSAFFSGTIYLKLVTIFLF